MFPDLSFEALRRECSTRAGDQGYQPYRRSLQQGLITGHEALLSATFGGLVEIPEWLKRECSEAIDDVLLSLTPREQRVIQLRFGFDGRWRTLRETGWHFTLTGERIRQIETKALRKLRHPVRAKPLLMPLLNQRQIKAEIDAAIKQVAEMIDRWPGGAGS